MVVGSGDGLPTARAASTCRTSTEDRIVCRGPVDALWCACVVSLATCCASSLIAAVMCMWTGVVSGAEVADRPHRHSMRDREWLVQSASGVSDGALEAVLEWLTNALLFQRVTVAVSFR